MPGQTGKSGVYCPFFKAEYDTVISCESPIPDTRRIDVRFLSRKSQNFHYLTYCSSENYRYCEIYRAVMEKYEEN